MNKSESENQTQPETVYQGRFLGMQTLGRWEYVVRTNSSTTVAILAITEDESVLFVEQFRPPVGQTVIELPAGLVGDDGDPDELAQIAAGRELEEETGYASEQLESLGTFCSSAGLTNEVTTLFLARACRQVGAGGGIGNESIRIHKIPQKEAASWLQKHVESGKLMDGKVWTALALAHRHGVPLLDAAPEPG